MATEKQVSWDNQSVLGNLKQINEQMNTILEGIEFIKSNSNNKIAEVEKKVENNEEITPIDSIINLDNDIVQDVENIINKQVYTIVDKNVPSAFMENGLARSMPLDIEQIKNLSTSRSMIK